MEAQTNRRLLGVAALVCAAICIFFLNKQFNSMGSWRQPNAGPSATTKSSSTVTEGGTSMTITFSAPPTSDPQPIVDPIATAVNPNTDMKETTLSVADSLKAQLQADVDALVAKLDREHSKIANIEASCCWMIASIKFLESFPSISTLLRTTLDCTPISRIDKSHSILCLYSALFNAIDNLKREGCTDEERASARGIANKCLRVLRSPIHSYFLFEYMSERFRREVESQPKEFAKDSNAELFSDILLSAVFLSDLAYASEDKNSLIDKIRSFDKPPVLRLMFTRPRSISEYGNLVCYCITPISCGQLRGPAIMSYDLKKNFHNAVHELLDVISEALQLIVKDEKGKEGALNGNGNGNNKHSDVLFDAPMEVFVERSIEWVDMYFEYRFKPAIFNQDMQLHNSYAMRLSGKNPMDNFCGESKEFISRFLLTDIGPYEGLGWEIKGIRVKQHGDTENFRGLSDLIARYGSLEKTFPVPFLSLSISDCFGLEHPTLFDYLLNVVKAQPYIRFNDYLVILINNYFPSNENDASDQLLAKGFKLVKDSVQGPGSYTFLDINVQQEFEITYEDGVEARYLLKSFNVDMSDGKSGHVINVTGYMVMGMRVYVKFDGTCVSHIPDITSYLKVNSLHISAVLYAQLL